MRNMSIGKQNFKEMIDHQGTLYHYVDKSQLIEDVMSDDIILYSRPRRFGKTLNMSMLYYFFSFSEKDNAYLFNDLKISRNKEAMEHQNKYALISITFGGCEANNLNTQINLIGDVIELFISKHQDLYESTYLSNLQKDKLYRLESRNYQGNDLINSLQFLSQCMALHYKRKVIILIDEYDVPLKYAYDYGYYDEMHNFMSMFLSKSLKYNDDLYKAVLTGCLPLAKESSYTGLNNVTVRDVLDYDASDCFGFTEAEVIDFLKDYDLEDRIDEIKLWYDGYRFGDQQIYNPLSVSKCVQRLLKNNPNSMDTYWIGTGSNIEIKHFIEQDHGPLKKEFKILEEGKSIIKSINPQITYEESNNPKYIYTFLLYTGYLTIKHHLSENRYELMIPNNEVKKTYTMFFSQWFEKEYSHSLFIESLLKGDVSKAQEILEYTLLSSFSFYYSVEEVYEAFLLGYLSDRGYKVDSEKESGYGRYDLFVYNLKAYPALIIECKYSESIDSLEKDAKEGLRQIRERKYIEGKESEGYSKVLGYSIAFHRKRCLILKL